MNQKSLLSLLLACSLLLTFCACGEKPVPEEPPATPSAATDRPEPSEPPVESEELEKPGTGEKGETETPPPEEKEEPAAGTLRVLREKAAGCVCAVAYVGYTETGTIEDVSRCIADGSCAEDYPFVREIPASRIVNPGGCDVYCIVPVDEDAALTVRRLDMDEEGAELVGETVYAGGGEPILLVCNISDILPNCVVSVELDGEELRFSPYISLKDGSMATTASAGTIYDFT